MTLKELSECNDCTSITSIWVHHKFKHHGKRYNLDYNRIRWRRYIQNNSYESVEIHDERFNVILIKFNNQDTYFHGVPEAINLLKNAWFIKPRRKGTYTYINGMFDYTHSDIIDEFDLLVMGYRSIATYGNIVVYGSETRNDMYVVIPNVICGKRIPVYIDSRDNINVFTSLMSRVSFINQ